MVLYNSKEITHSHKYHFNKSHFSFCMMQKFWFANCFISLGRRAVILRKKVLEMAVGTVVLRAPVLGSHPP